MAVKNNASSASGLVARVEAFFQQYETPMSIAFGVIVVFISATLLLRYIKVWKNSTGSTPEPTTTTAAQTTEKLPVTADLSKLPASYTVQKGDSTWKVAQAFYGSGYNYVDIESASKLKHDQYIEVGMKLEIPKVDVKRVTKTTVAAQKTAVPVITSYTVQKGDSLWKIAIAQYHNGYKWAAIYKANAKSVKNPSVIEKGMVLAIPR